MPDLERSSLVEFAEPLHPDHPFWVAFLCLAVTASSVELRSRRGVRPLEAPRPASSRCGRMVTGQRDGVAVGV
jgi:hypothetical protein